jgi:methyltransferase (TIGR00027 family)
MRVARRRAAHQVLDQPVVFHDPLALAVAGIAGDETLKNDPHEQHPVARALRAFLAARSRFAEDHLARAIDRGTRQYVVLGAGLDTLAYRHPYGSRLTVFEVDYPATQAWKRERLADAGIDIPPSVRYVAVDFERETAFEGLAAAGFDAKSPAFFSWLGVTVYLSELSVLSMLESIAGLAPGSGIAFDYAIDSSGVSERARRAVEVVAARAAAAGEPWTLFFDPEQLKARLRGWGFSTIEDLDGAAINSRYFAGRSDGLRVGGLGRLAYVATAGT